MRRIFTSLCRPALPVVIPTPPFYAKSALCRLCARHVTTSRLMPGRALARCSHAYAAATLAY